MRGSYYDVLGVSPTAHEEEIRARYLLLMRHHHPDVSRSPLAHARASQISEAFQALSSATLRAQHDAELAQQRLDAVSARAVNLSRVRNGRSLMVRRRPLLRRYGARLTLATLLAATALAGWRIERRLVGREDASAALVGQDVTDREAHEAVIALQAATAREAQAMPPVSAATVASGVGAFRRIAMTGGLAQARAFSERCHAAAVNAGTWSSLDFCVAFDQAAYMSGDKTLASSSASGGYFVARHDGAAHLYVSRLSSLDTIGLRLDRIRGQIALVPERSRSSGPARVFHSIAKRGWKLAGAARDMFADDRVDRAESVRKARDF